MAARARGEEPPPGQLASTAVVEVTIRYAQGWALHDFPLSLDLDAWYGMIAAERAALGLTSDGTDLPPDAPWPASAALQQ